MATQAVISHILGVIISTPPSTPRMIKMTIFGIKKESDHQASIQLLSFLPKSWTSTPRSRLPPNRVTKGHMKYLDGIKSLGIVG